LLLWMLSAFQAIFSNKEDFGEEEISKLRSRQRPRGAARILWLTHCRAILLNKVLCQRVVLGLHGLHRWG
jgi:hypothetical protein